MCQTIGYKSIQCGHHWLCITKPCGPGMNFNTTPWHYFQGNRTLFNCGRIKFFNAPIGSCPNCDMRGIYNGDTTRLVICKGLRERQIYQNGYPYGYMNGFVQNLGSYGNYNRYDFTYPRQSFCCSVM